MPPSMLDVLITTPGSPDAIMRGTNESMPLATPKTLTEKHQVQSFGSCSQGRPPPPDVTPALLKRRWHAPSFPNTSSASASTEARRRDIGHDAPHGAEVGELLHRDLEHRRLDVGDDDAGPLFEQRLGDAAADARCSPGDDGNLAVQIIQRVPPLF